MNLMSHWFFWTFLFFFVVNEVWESFLTILNIRHTHKHKDEIPSFYQARIDQETYQKSVRYTLEKARFGLIINFLSLILIWAAILSGSFNFLEKSLSGFIPPNTLNHSVAYCMTLGLILLILKIPVSLYSNFILEEKYGFNKMTLKTFVSDLLKGLLLGILLGVPLLYLIFWLYQTTGSWWWLWAFGALFGFELFLAAVYPTLLAPLFNKFIPLPNGELKQAILDIAKKVNFKMSGIYTIDGSKRSAHSNAYFAGMGKMRRIVLFDTLLKSLTDKEIISVLAHEMGHNIKKHVQKHLLISFITSLIGFWVLSLIIQWSPFFQAFNAGAPSPHKALILFALFAGYFTFWLTPLMNYLSRKHEYEADRFSVESTGDKENMASSLIKLSKDNLSNLTPHPAYSFYHYSHPTTVERVQAIKNV